MKQVLLPILGTIAFILVVGLLTKGNFLPKSPTPTQTPGRQVRIGATTIAVEIADTDAKRSLGLGKRTSLDKDSGVLFIFPQKDVTRNFWMKDMNFAIDIIWVNDGKIVKIDKNVPPQPEVADSALKNYSSGTPVDYVLEVNAGFSEKGGVNVGSTVDLTQAL